jgi:hypothetical protein
VKDCPDFSDEEWCSCGERQEAARRCDRVPDCADRSDEADCGLCEEGEWFCSLSREKHGPARCVREQHR